jgi:hypothetical protein
MLWPPPKNATVTIFAGKLDLPVRNPADATLRAMPQAETSPPEPTTTLRPGVLRIDRIGLELGFERSFKSTIDGDDPLSVATESRLIQTIARDPWRVRIETQTKMSCTQNSFRLHATLLAWDGDDEVCRREWNHEIPRDLL